MDGFDVMWQAMGSGMLIQECVICTDGLVQASYVPSCGHRHVCDKCHESHSPDIYDIPATCVTCRRPITGFTRVHAS